LRPPDTPVKLTVARATAAKTDTGCKVKITASRWTPFGDNPVPDTTETFVDSGFTEKFEIEGAQTNKATAGSQVCDLIIVRMDVECNDRRHNCEICCLEVVKRKPKK
jgi:hypothetical protein